MSGTKSFDVIMAGGGVMGCATAYYLLQADPTMKVAIVEMDPEYKYNSTVLSDGNTRLQFNLKENILISLYGLERLRTFKEDMAVGDWQPEIDPRLPIANRHIFAKSFQFFQPVFRDQDIFLDVELQTDVAV